MLDRRSGSFRKPQDNLNIPAKANRVLNVVLVGMLLIVLRVWHLAVIQYDEKVEESRKPQRRTVKEAAKRATIRDRFNIPLAINKVQYQVGVLYSQLRQIPTAAWETGPEGKRHKVFKRKEYITKLSEILAKELGLDPERIEDLIHAKASFYNNIPFVIKEGITEKEYYRLKMLEKDWLGISVQRVPVRHYPKGRVGGDLLGYMGAINRQEYEGIIQETTALQKYVKAIDEGEAVPLPEGVESEGDVRRRLKDLQELSYSINDSIGKTGIEGRYESILRGFHGKKSYYSDSRGNFLRELPGTREALSGKRLLLTISAELQEYAEQLLVQNEQIRVTRLSHIDEVKRTILALKEPWIKGGAIVVMDPNNGEVLALASTPRFDPNDFIVINDKEDKIAKTTRINKWLENEAHLADIWNQLHPIDREFFDAAKGGFYDDGVVLTWQNYLDRVLAPDSPLRTSIVSQGTIKQAYSVLSAVEKLMDLSPGTPLYSIFNLIYRSESFRPYGKKLPWIDNETLEKVFTERHEEVRALKYKLDPYIGNMTHSYDQVLLVDLLRILVNHGQFSDELMRIIGNQDLRDYKDAASAMVAIDCVVKDMARTIFHDTDFNEWRNLYQKEFLKEKRAEEKAKKKYAKPYIDYLDKKESEIFTNFWKEKRFCLIVSFLKGICPDTHQSKTSFMTEQDKEEALLIDIAPYVSHMLSWQQEIAQGAHLEISWMHAYQRLKEHIKTIPTEYVISYLDTLRSFQDLDRPLLGSYGRLRRNSDKTQQEKHLAAAFYPKYGWGYGRSYAYRQASTQGSIFKLVTAYEALVQRYKKLQDAGKDTADLNPLEMVDEIYHKGKNLYVGYNGEGQPLPRFYKGGRVPRSTHSIGKLDLLTAIETSSNPYFALLAGDVIDSPSDLTKAAKLFSFGAKTGIDLPGEIPGKVPEDLEVNRTGLYSTSIGQHTLVVTPLQTSVMLSALANGGKVVKPKIVGMLAGRDPLRGMDLVSGKNAFPYEKSLSLVGIDFPLFSACDAREQKSFVNYVAAETRQVIFMPNQVQKILLESMCRVVARSQRDGIGSLSRLYSDHPEAIADYVELKNQLIGKTSTAESIETIDLDLKKGTNIYTHVWFGGVSYQQDLITKRGAKETFVFNDAFGNPEVTVVVYLRYGGFGKEAAPVAAQMVKKWREIKAKYQGRS